MLEAYKKQALKNVAGKDSALHKKFIEAFADQISENDASHFDESLYIGMLEMHWDLSVSRKSDEALLRIHSPAVEGSSRRKTVIDIVSNDMAFLVDSIAATVIERKCLIELLVHPSLYVKKTDKGVLQEVSAQPETGLESQSHIRIHIHEMLSDDDLKGLEDDLLAAIEDVRVANRDWKTMLVRLKAARDELEFAKTEKSQATIREYCAFMDYLYNNNFTLLGYAEYLFEDGGKKVKRSNALGVLSQDDRAHQIDDETEGFPRNLQAVKKALSPISLSKTKILTSVHRRVPMDVVAVRTYDAEGNIIGEKLFLGLFTSVTYSRSVKDIPYVRLKIDKVMEMAGYTTGSHDSKALRHILEKYPRDELFQIDSKVLHQTCLHILRLQERQRIALFTRRDPFGSYISCMVYVPRDRFGTALRKQIVKTLEQELDGVCGSFFTSMDDSLFARGLFRIDVDPLKPVKFKVSDIEEKLQALGQTWAEKISLALESGDCDEGRLQELTLKYGDAFPVNYTNAHSPKQAIFDIEKIEETLETGQLQLDLYRPADMPSDKLRLKTYHLDEPIVLADILPILAHLGVKAIAEMPYRIEPDEEGQSVWIHDFLLELADGGEIDDISPVKAIFEEAFTRVWYNQMESDALNQLVLRAKLPWRDIVILRSYVKYAKQARSAHSQQSIQKALTKHAGIAGDLVALFHAYLDPSNADDKGQEITIDAVRNRILESLRDVDVLNEDRIMRLIKMLIEATLRTNFYQQDAQGQFKPYVSLKLDSHAISILPNPKPFREIFVYSTRVEGVHLRGDRIARGGLRWSDRHDDFRTEVLGLMKAQMVKNSVIVPMGSKGGFVVKTPTHSRDEFIAEGIECYKIFIRGLLDITDNLKGGKVLPPMLTARRDGDDPYLVVAADKGTATFSDIANGLSQEYGFWLDDAFASGGSAGYDHKKMGITARGAWESVKLHFRQLNHNTQTDAFDAVGVGDMGGDVFGNGMLLSEHIRLIGAFNHLHIFCDPDPDIPASYKERKRLFKKVAGWDQYNTDLLSKGGRIYSRAEKSLKLTAEIKQRFDITQDEVSPDELILAILKSRTDLLWFGGIGTYIKATSESDAEVGDKANDALRVNATDLRARVIGEGANLGVTQRGRIEFAQKGGKINTDFIDNSGGVDSSDHEVNIKILLSAVMKDKKHNMDIEARNKLLESMTKDIEDHVLRHNYQQAQAVSLAELQAKDMLGLQNEFIEDMQREEGLDRAGEFLPDREEVQKRLREGRGLTRPELAVLISYAKISLTKGLLETDIPDLEDMRIWLRSYFPKALRAPYAQEIEQHRLHREIVAMTVANSLINRLGPTFIKRTMKKTGRGCADIVKAYIIVREVFGLREMWDDLEALDNKAPASVLLRSMLDMTKLTEFAMTWFLNHPEDKLDVSSNVALYAPIIGEIRKNLTKTISGELKASLESKIAAFENDGLPAALAADIAALPMLNSALDIAYLVNKSDEKAQRIAAIYFELGDRFNIGWLKTQARYKEPVNRWDQEATEGLIDKLYNCQFGFADSVLAYAKKNGIKSGSEVAYWVENHSGPVSQIDPFFDDLHHTGSLDLPMLVVAEQRLRHLFGG